MAAPREGKQPFGAFGSEIELGGMGSADLAWRTAPLEGESPQSRWQRVLQKLRSPLVAVSLGALGITLLLVVVAAAGYATGRHSRPLEVSGCAGLSEPTAAGDTVAPEGSISSDFGATHDWRGRPRSLASEHGMVAADHGRCSDIGAAVLRENGTAVDAAIATALCQGIFNPMASGVGGGHFMLIRKADGMAECIDAREVAPAAANESMFEGRSSASVDGGLAVAVPLELQGMWVAHQRHGRLPWKRLLQPAIKLAEDGFPAHPYLVAGLSGANQTAALQRWPAIRDTFLIREGGEWRPPRVNETCCKRPKLAETLRAVASEGPDALYLGEHAKALAADIQAAGGIITAEDLAAAAASIRQPIKHSIWGYEWIAAPPPSSAATVLAAMQILEGFAEPLAGSGSLGVHRLVEAMKHSFALRMNLGDPGPDANGHSFLNLTSVLAAMGDPHFISSLRSLILDNATQPLAAYGGAYNVTHAGLHPEDHGTSHIAVVDRDRMAVSMTTTVNTAFGSKVISPSTGILLNNQMDDFSTPGQPNIYGIQPSPANFIRPGKKPFSSMSPLIAERGGAFQLAVGASGGPRIISAVLQTVVRLVAGGEELFHAVANPRLHHQLAPDSLYIEDWNATSVSFHYSEDMAGRLAARGHAVARTSWGAITQAVRADPESGRLRGVSDPRKDGAPAAA